MQKVFVGGRDVHVVERNVGSEHLRHSHDNAGDIAPNGGRRDVADGNISPDRGCGGGGCGSVGGRIEGSEVDGGLGRPNRVVEAINRDREVYVGHDKIEIAGILHGATAITVRLHVDAVLSAVKCAVADQQVMHPSNIADKLRRNQAADGKAVSAPKETVGDGDVRRSAAAAPDLNVVVANADRAIPNQNVGRSQVHPVGVVGVKRRILGNPLNRQVYVVALNHDVERRRVL